jgi:hypothetical protein
MRTNPRQEIVDPTDTKAKTEVVENRVKERIDKDDPQPNGAITETLFNEPTNAAPKCEKVDPIRAKLRKEHEEARVAKLSTEAVDARTVPRTLKDEPQAE